jgi:hypothetical protein
MYSAAELKARQYLPISTYNSKISKSRLEKKSLALRGCLAYGFVPTMAAQTSSAT